MSGEVGERPILFSAPMIRAILDRKKTVTRRVLNPQPAIANVGPGTWVEWVHGKRIGGGADERAFAAHAVDRCPYGKPGDRLWVRETWGEVAHIDWSDPRGEPFVHVLGPDERCIVYREEASRYGFEWTDEPETRGWRPSIHMPRWASRLTLEVVDVRVERLQEISEEAANAEGVPAEKVVAFQHPFRPRRRFGHGTMPCTHREAFTALWDGINGKRAPWDSNPWVWVIAFRADEGGGMTGSPLIPSETQGTGL